MLCPVILSLCSTVMVKTVWDRDEKAFILVSWVARTRRPMEISDMTSSYKL